MNKGELLDEIYRKNDLTRQECRSLFDSAIECIMEAVAEGERVKLVNFGTFIPSPRKATKKLHPVTREEIDVPAKVVPRFSPGKGFKEALRENLKVTKDGSGELEAKQQ